MLPPGLLLSSIHFKAGPTLIPLAFGPPATVPLTLHRCSEIDIQPHKPTNTITPTHKQRNTNKLTGPETPKWSPGGTQRKSKRSPRDPKPPKGSRHDPKEVTRRNMNKGIPKDPKESHGGQNAILVTLCPFVGRPFSQKSAHFRCEIAVFSFGEVIGPVGNLWFIFARVVSERLAAGRHTFVWGDYVDLVH